MTHATLKLNPRADYRIRSGHLWIYSNEIDNNFCSLKSLNPGSLAIIVNAQNQPLGLAYVNPNTLICARLLTTDSNATIDLDFFREKIFQALALRKQMFTSNFYRLVFGESDFLPGLVVDRFDNTIVVQISTAGMEQYLDLILQALDQIIAPQTIVIKNDGKMREVEGLANYITCYKGNMPEDLYIEENGAKFMAPLAGGQKTGWFYDHKMTRARLQNYVKNKRVLDLFSYVGSWGIQAGVFGAKEVVCNDASALALSYIANNAELNHLLHVTTMPGDAFDVAQDLIDKGEKFDVVILDPPAFIARRKDLHKGAAAYLKANVLAMRLLNKNGVLVSGSCSMHLQATDLRAIIHKAGIKTNRPVRFLEQGHQGPDHPIHAAIPETEYLKSFIVTLD